MPLPSRFSHFYGSGLTSQTARDRLVERLREQGISNEQVLEIIRQIPRHHFIDEALENHAYNNTALPIGFGQTISQPYIVAKMTEALIENGRLEKVLEIGTGCGYQTAVLAHFAKQVYSIERIGSFLISTQKRLEQLNIKNIQLIHGDGYLGLKQHAPFQGILVAAAPPEIPQTLLNQLAINGRLIIPVGENAHSQILYQITRTHNGFDYKPLNNVCFVPLQEGIR
jgi:protein-L-isoaspartate(D-aspartate) O-methyltransferase